MPEESGTAKGCRNIKRVDPWSTLLTSLLLVTRGYEFLVVLFHVTVIGIVNVLVVDIAVGAAGGPAVLRILAARATELNDLDAQRDGLSR